VDMTYDEAEAGFYCYLISTDVHSVWEGTCTRWSRLRFFHFYTDIISIYEATVSPMKHQRRTHPGVKCCKHVRSNCHEKRHAQ